MPERPDNFGLTKVLDGLRSVLNPRQITRLESGQYVNDYTSSVNNYSGIFDKNNSYKKFDYVYNTGDGLYYYARDDLTEGIGVSITEANRFSLETGAPTVPDHKISSNGYYLFDENNLLTTAVNQRIEAGHTIEIGGSLSGSNGNYRVLAVDEVSEAPKNLTGTVTGALGATLMRRPFGLAEANQASDFYQSTWLFRTMIDDPSLRNLNADIWDLKNLFDFAQYVDDNDDVTAGYNTQASNFSKSEYGRFHWENIGKNQSYRKMPIQSTFIYNTDLGSMHIFPSSEATGEAWFSIREGASNNFKTLWASTGTMGGGSPGGQGLAWMQNAGDGKLGPTGWTHWERDIHFNPVFGDKIRVYNFANQKWYAFKGDGINGSEASYEEITSRVSAPTSYPLVNSPGDSPATETQDYESPFYAPVISDVSKVTRLWLESADSTSSIDHNEPSSSNAITLSVKGADPSVNPDSWSKDLFFFDADYGSRATFRANNSRTEFGNGYYILQPKNINSLSAEFNLTFKNRTSREAAAMAHFIEHHLGQHEGQSNSPNLRYKLGISGFRWDGNATYHPYDSTENQVRQFYCTNFTHSLNFDNSNDLNVTLRNLNASLLQKSEQLYVNKAETYDASKTYELNDVAFYTGNHQYYYWHSNTSSSNKPPAESSHAEWSTVSGYYVDLNTGFWTRDFFWRPSIGLQVNHQPRVQSLSLNGYTQIYNDGINENLLELDLSFNGRDDEECAAILHYLEDHQGHIPFRFLPPAPYDKLSNYVCQEWTHTYDYKNSHTINAKFEQYPFNFSANQYSDSDPPPELGPGRLIFTNPLIFVEPDGPQDVIVNQNVKARAYFQNIGDKDIDISSALTSFPFSFVGQTSSSLPIVKDSADRNHYVIRNPTKGLPFNLDGQYLRISKSYTKEPQGGQFFTVVTGDENASLPYRNKKVVRNGIVANDVYFQNNMGEITSGIEHTFPITFTFPGGGQGFSGPPKESCNYYMVESLFTGKYVTTLEAGERAFMDVVFSGLEYAQLEFGFKYDEDGEFDDHRIRWGNSDDSSTGHIIGYATNDEKSKTMIINSNDPYDPLTGKLSLYLSSDRLSDDSPLTTIRTPTQAGS